ncbi:flagellar biosynthesis regulator FlaF [Roseococcus sp. DSY-14]|uniref:flagellar biosynthesis regulator FlaF n=1 Tax=Roseococcus sp. DSY-14 TaxID=3369650 RepID=UPI00387ABEA3
MLQTRTPPGAAAYSRSLTPRQMEAQVFSRVVRRLREAERPADRARAGADARRLWSAVFDLVSEPANQLPAPLRAQIASLALAVQRECDGETPDLGFVADVTDEIARGLWG